MADNIFLLGRSGKLEKFGAIEMPEFKVISSVDWVINGTQKDWYNNQPNYYNYLYQSSAKNTAIINSKSRYIYGKGWGVDASGLDPLTELITVKAFLKKIEKSKVTERIILDKVIHGGFAAEMIADAAGRVMPHHIDFGNIRVSKPEYDKDGKELPEKYYYTKDWTKGNNAKNNKDFVTFYPFDWEKMEKGKRYLVYYTDYRPNADVYPLPEYMGGVPYISADAQVGNFVKNNVENGFTAGVLVNFFSGKPTPAQQAEIEKKWRDRKHGTSNAGLDVLSFNENKDSGVEITPLSPNGQDDRYINLNKQIRDEIFTAHTTSALVVGMEGEGGLANNADQKRTAIEDFQQSYVAPKQEPINEFMNSVLTFNEIKGEVYLQRLDPIMPQLTSDVFVANHSRAEIRKLFGSPEEKEPADVATQVLKEINLKFKKHKCKECEGKGEDCECMENYEKFSTLDSEFIHIDSQELFATDLFDAKNQAQKFRQSFASNIQNAITKLLIGEPDLTVKDLAKLLNDTPKNIKGVLDEMQSNGLIEGTTPTAEGIAESEDNQIFVVYKYVVRNDAPKLETHSREFCIEMMKLSQTRSWTFEQIEQISAREGYDVFARRGGWYHNPDTGKNTPYCRHIFQQRLVRKK